MANTVTDERLKALQKKFGDIIGRVSPKADDDGEPESEFRRPRRLPDVDIVGFDEDAGDGFEL